MRIVVITTTQFYSTTSKPRFYSISNPAWGPSEVRMIPTKNIAQQLSSVNHSTKLIVLNHIYYHHLIWWMKSWKGVDNKRWLAILFHFQFYHFAIALKILLETTYKSLEYGFTLFQLTNELDLRKKTHSTFFKINLAHYLSGKFSI